MHGQGPGLARRHLLLAVPSLGLLAGCSPSPVHTFPTLASAAEAVKQALRGHRSRGAWSLAQVLDHAAQSIEYSMRGYPQMKSAVFRATVGSAAFAVFDSRGAMRHGLDEPIPGAPALGADVDAAGGRLLKAMQEFERFDGVLQPHFAYGSLDKAQYTRAHLMHLANHWQEVERSV